MEIDRYDQMLIDVLNGPFAHSKTRDSKSCIDRDGRPIPWYTYPALEYLSELDVSEKRVFEYGSGASSSYWARRALEVTSVEQDPEWHGEVSRSCQPNQAILLRTEKDGYVQEARSHGTFDVIVIDGEWRRECAEIAMPLLNAGGVIILDNSDWYVKAAEVLRENGYLQVDMKGFGPINPYCWCTSFFFDRSFDFPRRHKYQPVHGLGSRDVLAAEEWPDGVPDPLSIR